MIYKLCAISELIVIKMSRIDEQFGTNYDSDAKAPSGALEVVTDGDEDDGHHDHQSMVDETNIPRHRKSPKSEFKVKNEHQLRRPLTRSADQQRGHHDHHPRHFGHHQRHRQNRESPKSAKSIDDDIEVINYANYKIMKSTPLIAINDN